VNAYGSNLTRKRGMHVAVQSLHPTPSVLFLTYLLIWLHLTHARAVLRALPHKLKLSRVALTQVSSPYDITTVVVIVNTVGRRPVATVIATAFAIAEEGVPQSLLCGWAIRWVPRQ